MAIIVFPGSGYKAHEIADRFDSLGHYIVEAEFSYLILNRDQQFEPVKPIGTKIIEASLINQAVKFDPKVLRDNVANRGDEAGAHDHPTNSADHRKSQTIQTSNDPLLSTQATCANLSVYVAAHLSDWRHNEIKSTDLFDRGG